MQQQRAANMGVVYIAAKLAKPVKVTTMIAMPPPRGVGIVWLERSFGRSNNRRRRSSAWTGKPKHQTSSALIQRMESGIRGGTRGLGRARGVR